MDEGNPLGIISDFRLDCLPKVLVGWNEINTTMGQITLLLLIMSDMAGLQFQVINLLPMETIAPSSI